MEETNILKIPRTIMSLLEITERETNIHKLSLKTGITYAHLFKVIPELERKGLINVIKKGREKIITITLKGQRISIHLRAIRGVFN